MAIEQTAQAGLDGRSVSDRTFAPRYRWTLPVAPVLDGSFRDALVRRGISERLGTILATRGIGDDALLERFLGPADDGLHDPALLPDAAVALERVARARAAGERVLVLGDFDADGLTGLAILVRTLRRLGLECVPYVPDRTAEGHGLSIGAVERAVAERCTLIVTVDTGTSSVAEIALANGRGIDVIVTDHHHCGTPLPPALAVVNPMRPDSRYPERTLTGSGIAFRFAELLLRELEGPEGVEHVRALADLALVGTVADLGVILGENRSIARIGLERLRTRPNPGLAALMARANGTRTPAIDLGTIGFAIAPRLNAASRVGDALDAARLLLTDDPDEVARQAEILEAHNLNRRELTSSATAEASGLADPGSAPAVIVRGPWPVGIIGLVAARLAEEWGRPAIVVSDLGDTLRASCRGSGGVNLAASLETCSDLFMRHGGHAGAAGFELDPARWDDFRHRFLQAVSATPVAPATPTLPLDLAIEARDLAGDLVGELDLLAPTGTGNPDVLVGVLGLTVTRVRAANGGHTQLTLRRERDVVDAIAFRWPELATLVREGDRIDVAARLTMREFNGIRSMQLEIRDAAPAGAPIAFAEEGAA